MKEYNVGPSHATRSIVFLGKLIGCAYLNPSSIELCRWNIFYRRFSFRYLTADNNYSKHKYFLHIRNSLFSLNQIAILFSFLLFSLHRTYVECFQRDIES